MADSVTHKEFFQKQNKQHEKEDEMSPIDTETTLEDMQESIIQVQDSLKLLTNKTIQDRVNHYKEQQTMKKRREGLEVLGVGGWYLTLPQCLRFRLNVY